MLARLQQIITLSLLAAAAAWLALWWQKSHLLALAGFLFIAFGYSLVLGLEFVLLRLMGSRGTTRAPTIPDLARAWLGETLTAPQVFCWRQPFRANEVPDLLVPPEAMAHRRGVVLVHGFFCNRGLWTPWLKQLRKDGHAFVAVNLEPVLGSIDHYADIVEEAVNRVTLATGTSPVIVCHSMGGLAVRAWLRAHQGPGRAHHIVTIGTPHGGTWIGRFSRAANGKEMRLASEWLRALAAHEESNQVTPFTCWYSDCDNIVFPSATATLPGADNRLVRGVAHVQLAFHPAVMAGSLAIISAV